MYQWKKHRHCGVVCPLREEYLGTMNSRAATGERYLTVVDQIISNKGLLICFFWSIWPYFQVLHKVCSLYGFADIQTSYSKGILIHIQTVKPLCSFRLLPLEVGRDSYSQRTPDCKTGSIHYDQHQCACVRVTLWGPKLDHTSFVG